MLSAILSGLWVSLCVMEALLLLSHCTVLCEKISVVVDYHWKKVLIDVLISHDTIRCHIGWRGRQTVLRAVTHFSAACILVSAVLLHDGLLHHCRLRKIPLRHSERWPRAVAVE